MKSIIAQYITKKNLFSTNDSRFELRTALQVVGVPLIGLAFFAFAFSQFLSSIQSFFFAIGIESDQAIFFDYIFSDLSSQFPYLVLYFSIIFFVGSYLSILLLRPFKKIESYCRQSLNNPQAYQDFTFSGIEGKKLLTRMSISFFQFIAICRQSKIFEAQAMEQDISDIKGPKADWVFYLQYTAVLLIIALLCGVGLYVFLIDTFEAIVTLSQQGLGQEIHNLSHSKMISTYLTHQRSTLDIIFYCTIGLISLLYILLGRHIVDTVNGVSFAFFRHMRQILEGDFTVRASVRFKDPGHSAVEAFNQFLDQVIPSELRLKKNVPSESLSETVSENELGTDLDAPPPLITQENNKNGIFYHLITQEGDKVIARSKERLLKLLNKLR